MPDYMQQMIIDDIKKEMEEESAKTNGDVNDLVKPIVRMHANEDGNNRLVGAKQRLRAKLLKKHNIK